MGLDMKTPIFNRDQVNSLISGFGLLNGNGCVMPRDWNIHIGPGTTVSISFRGPVGADEWDALLAHIAFYKQWYKDMPSTGLLNLQDAVEEVVKQIAEKQKQAETA